MNTKSTSGILSEILLFLSLIAMMPYEFGDIAAVLGPDAKKWVAFSGAVAAFLIKAITKWIDGQKEIAAAKENKDAGPKLGNLIIVFALIPALFLSGCTWNIDAQTKQKAAASGKVLARVGGKFAWQMVLNSFTSYADKDQKANYLDTLAIAARAAQANNLVVTKQDFIDFVNPWLPDKPHWDLLTEQVAQLVEDGVRQGLDKDQLLEQLAQQFNVTAANVRALVNQSK